MTKPLVEKALDAELTEHLGHGKHELVANAAGNTHNSKSKKTLKGDFGDLPIEVPRDRHSTVEPQLVPKHQTCWSEFDEKILSLYARGMTVREIQSHLEEMYGTEVSPSLNYVSWKRRPEVAADLKRIYQSATAEEADGVSANSKQNGMTTTCRSASPGAGTGHC